MTAGLRDFLSLKAKAQLRDQNGRWIEMGAEVLIHKPDGSAKAARITDVGDADGYVGYTNMDGEKGTAFHKMVEKIAAILPGEDIDPDDSGGPKVREPWGGMGVSATWPFISREDPDAWK